MLWHKERNGVRCDLCAVNCFVSKEKFGYCQIRKNISNELYTFNYGKVALNIDNVEKRPLFHFYPGSKSLTVASQGTEGWEISHDRFPRINFKEYSPENLVKTSEKEKTDLISFTHSEPTLIFEFVYRTFKFSHRSNIKNIFVTNGVITTEAVKKLAKYLDAVVVNFKASGDKDFMSKFFVIQDINPIFRAIKQMRKQRVHIEITNTIIPQIGDDVSKCRKLAEWVTTELSPIIPFHILQFHPDERLTELPFTPIATLERCADEAKKAGLRYVYIGNIIEPHGAENTYCYNCRELLIHRISGVLKKSILLRDRCPNCGVKIDIAV